MPIGPLGTFFRRWEPPKPLTYADVGVDVERKAGVLKKMGDLVEGTRRPGVMGGIGAFGGLFHLDTSRYPDPVLVSSADGVGTKLRLAFLTGRHDTMGIDLVAMNVDDLVCQGAEPLFFLDYIGISKVDEDLLLQIASGIAEGCRRAGCALIGGETAELPEFYKPGEYDLAGFAVGVVNRDRIIDGQSIRPGDALVGLRSSGLHSNGYALARRVMLKEFGGVWDRNDIPRELGRPVIDELLEPTRIYAPNIIKLRDQVEIKGIAHITGGGLHKNIPRMLPEGLGAELDWGAWEPPPIFEMLQRLGPIEPLEMERTFNLGLGMVLAVDAADAERCVEGARSLGEQAWVVGRVVDRTGVVVRR